jgi:hypothetical protein
LQSQRDCLGLKIKKEITSDATFIHSDLDHAKMDKPRENEAKIWRSKNVTVIKKVDKLHFGYKLHSTTEKE